MGPKNTNSTNFLIKDNFKKNYINDVLENHPGADELVYKFLKDLEKNEHERFLKVSEVEEILKLSRPVLNMLFDKGVLRGSLTPNGHRRFDKQSVDEYQKSIDEGRAARLKFYQENDGEDFDI